MPRDLLSELQGPPGVKAARDLLAAEKPAFSGAVLPFSRSQEGETYFDPNAGLLGPITRFGKSVGSVASGNPVTEQDVNATIGIAPYVLPAPPRLQFGGKGVSAVDPGLRRGAPAPSAAALKEAGGAGREAARGLGVDYGVAFRDLAQRLQSELVESGINAELAPKVFEALAPRANAPDDAIFQLSDVLTLKQVLKNARLDFTQPTQRGAAENVIRQLDDFILAPPPGSVVARPTSAARSQSEAEQAAREAARLLERSNANYAAGKRSERLTGTAAERAEGKAGILPKAESRAAVTNSGANLENVIRQRVEGLLDDPKLSSGFSKEELAELESIKLGTRGRNATRRIANLLGGGGGLGQFVAATSGGGLGAAAGAAVGSPLIGALLGTIPAGVGMVARAGVNKATKSALQAVDEAVRMRSPLYEELLKSIKPEINVSPEKRAAIVRALMMARQPPPAAVPPYTYGPGGNTL